MTKGLPSLTTAAQEFVVPRSIPITGPVGFAGLGAGSSSASSTGCGTGCGGADPGASVGRGSGGGAGRRDSQFEGGGTAPGAVLAPGTGEVGACGAGQAAAEVAGGCDQTEVTGASAAG